MDPVVLEFFPYPHVLNGERRAGILVDWPGRCHTCNRECEKSPVGPPQLCSYGVNFQRVTDELLVAGVVISDYSKHTPARGKMLRAVKKEAIQLADLEKTVRHCAKATADLERELRERKDAVIQEYRESRGYQQEVVELLRPELERTLGQVHDYKQVVQQIIQNLDVHLESKTPGLPIEDKVDKATHQEAAIYSSARIMDEKLDAALFVLYPERITNEPQRKYVRFHGIVSKYEKIYRARIQAKKLRIHYVGNSWGQVECDPRAIAIIPHALIDNAIKYAPEHTDITLRFKESDADLNFAVESYGPAIGENERSRIFELFFRGSAAERVSAEGTGFGLASAQHVAKLLGTSITVSQTHDDQGPRNTFKTTFEITLEISSPSNSDRGAPTRRPLLRTSAKVEA